MATKRKATKKASKGTGEVSPADIDRILQATKKVVEKKSDLPIYIDGTEALEYLNSKDRDGGYVAMKGVFIALGEMVAEGRLKGTVGVPEGREGEHLIVSVSVESMKEAIGRVIAHRATKGDAKDAGVSLEKANREIGFLSRDIEGDSAPESKWKGQRTYLAWCEGASEFLDGILAKVEAVRKPLVLDPSVKDFSAVLEAAKAARLEVEQYALAANIEGVRRQIAVLDTAELKASWEAELQKALGDAIAVRAIGKRLATAGYRDPQRKQTRPEGSTRRGAGDPMESLGSQLGRKFERGERGQRRDGRDHRHGRRDRD